MPNEDAEKVELIQGIATSLYGLRPRVHRCRSESNYVCRLEFGAALPDKIIKLAGGAPAQVLREQRILRALADEGLRVPAVAFTQDDCDVTDLPFLVMPQIPGASLIHGCRSNAPWVKHAIEQAARFLVQLGSLPCDLGGRKQVRVTEGKQLLLYARRCARRFLTRCASLRRRGQRDPRVREWVRAFSAHLDTDECRSLEQLLDDVGELSSREKRDFAHGSFSGNHILCDGGEISSVIDWEFAGPGFTFCDLGYFLAHLRKGGGGRPEFSRWFIDAYERERSLCEEDWAEIQVWEAYALIGWAKHFIDQGRLDKVRSVLNVARYCLTEERVA